MRRYNSCSHRVLRCSAQHDFRSSPNQLSEPAQQFRLQKHRSAGQIANLCAGHSANLPFGASPIASSRVMALGGARNTFSSAAVVRTLDSFFSLAGFTCRV